MTVKILTHIKTAFSEAMDAQRVGQEVKTRPVRQAEFTESMVAMTETMTVVREAVLGYRNSCLSMGFGESTADQMALHFHMMILHEITRNSRAQ